VSARIEYWTAETFELPVQPAGEGEGEEVEDVERRCSGATTQDETDEDEGEVY
jgi:hypothetical protein